MPHRHHKVSSKRLFFALWPDDKTRQQITTLYKQLHQPDYRPVKPSNLHITLAFLGLVDHNTEQQLIKQAGQILAPNLKLSFNQLNLWQKPRILCLTSAHAAKDLLKLANQIQRISNNCGIALEEKKYKPHITLARNASYKIDLNFHPINWRADSFMLVQSHHTKSNIHYQPLKNWSLN